MYMSLCGFVGGTVLKVQSCQLMGDKRPHAAPREGNHNPKPLKICRMYVSVCMCVYIYIGAYTYIYIYINTQIYYMYIHTYMRAYLILYMYTVDVYVQRIGCIYVLIHTVSTV